MVGDLLALQNINFKTIFPQIVVFPNPLKVLGRFKLDFKNELIL